MALRPSAARHAVRQCGGRQGEAPGPIGTVAPMASTPFEGNDRHLDDGIGQMLDGQRRSEAAEVRRRLRWLHQQSLEANSMGEVLRGWQARGSAIEAGVANGRQAGRIEHLGNDFAVLDAADGSQVVVRFDAIDWARLVATGPDQAMASTLPANSASTFLEVLRAQAQERDEVTLVLRDGATIDTAIEAVGIDVVHVRDRTGARLIVPEPKIAALRLR